ncbi:hypothetical protein NQ314_005478 [Rhamnusium bicolor]|uniref:Uncharacterized protein n=1 Tax=Rhamnusium bicolor TaxID=1586634 RepID=A0AAV8ZHZ3_9CUCU|nr:hypothetical protein NQ314_005478 [Rhamnusium bicolor]
MEVYAVHAVTERAKKQMKRFEAVIPRDWEDLIRTCRLKNPINVYSMQMSDFKNFTDLTKSPGPLYYERRIRMTPFSDEDFKELELQRFKRKKVVFPEDFPVWIPDEFHDFYRSIPHTENSELVPEEDSEEVEA